MLQQQFLNFKEVFAATACHLQEKIKGSTPGQLKEKQGNPSGGVETVTCSC